MITHLSLTSSIFDVAEMVMEPVCVNLHALPICITTHTHTHRHTHTHTHTHTDRVYSEYRSQNAATASVGVHK